MNDGSLALVLRSGLYIQTIVCLLSFLSIPFLGSSYFFIVIYFGLGGYILISFLFHLRRRLKANVAQITVYGVALIVLSSLAGFSLIMGWPFYIVFVILLMIIIPALIITYFFITIVDYQNLVKKGMFFNPTPRKKHILPDEESE